MSTQVIVLNGTSSSGKSTIARCLQAILPDPWLTLGIDTFLQTLPASMHNSPAGIEIAPGGAVTIGPEFRTLEAAWMQGVATMAQAGARIIIDDVFLSGATSQHRWQNALADLPVLWVAVHCDPTVATAREQARGDRIQGLAATQAPHNPPGRHLHRRGRHHPHRPPTLRPLHRHPHSPNPTAKEPTNPVT